MVAVAAEPEREWKLIWPSRLSTVVNELSGSLVMVMGGSVVSGEESGSGSSETSKKKRPLHLWPGINVSSQL